MATQAAVKAARAISPKPIVEKFGEQKIKSVKFLHPMQVADLDKPVIHGGVAEYKASEGLLLVEAPDGSIWFSGKVRGRIPMANVKLIEYAE